MANKIPVSVRLDKTQVDLFQRKYFGLMSKFMQSALDLALQDEEIFSSILFKTLKTNKEY